ncbi:substrate-binding domain-containing protein [Silvibacterium dinghuense]|uniref:substrate-binding domain-containing protein n=1 Tax=Silvibacterium dinghuense TaxID=1560006 RepID=UPI0013E9454E|nr:substrate-binding domain-containing protein [Silvibacterium dinghuense]GGH13831.1 ABC transporter substrate-binding protein [Silvibacterium dinghuense]
MAGQLPARQLHARCVLRLCVATLLAAVLSACSSGPPRIAVIPRACGTALWEPEHAGAADAARVHGISLYWNAPTRANDVQRQIALVERVSSEPYEGIVLAPDESLAFRTPVQRLLKKHMPLVVVGTELGIQPGDDFSYVLSDEAAAGQIAARRIGQLLHGQGEVAVLGMDPKLANIMLRERSFEYALAAEFPRIHVVARRMGQTDVSQEQETAEELLRSKSSPDAIVALSAESTRGAYYALVEFHKASAIKLVGFDQDLLPPLRTGDLDSVIVENTYEMGHLAIEEIQDRVKGEPVAARTVVSPKLVTRDNMDTPEIQKIFSARWWNEQ